MIYIGTISSVKGLDGSVILSDVPSGIKKLNTGDKVKIGFSEAFAKEFTVTKWIRLARHAMITLKEISTPEAALTYREQGVFIDKSKLKKNSLNNLDSDLAGYTAFEFKSGRELGKVSEVWEMPANNVLVIKSGENDYTIPLIPEFVKEIDEDKRICKVKLIEGFENLNEDE